MLVFTADQQQYPKPIKGLHLPSQKYQETQIQDIQTSYAKLPGSHMSAQLAENNDRKPSQSLAWGIHSANASEYQGMLFIQMLKLPTVDSKESARGF